MKLKEFNLNEISVKGLSVFVDEKEIACRFIGEELKGIPHFKDYEIKSTNYYIDTFVRL